ncbi:MAG: alpha-amylase family glycosyl hydrolase, partial [Planctomycetota bacterium]
MFHRLQLLVLALLLLPGSVFAQNGTFSADTVLQIAPSKKSNVPDWVADAVFYQLFPERFRNGDPKNDPDRNSLEDPQWVPDNWKLTPWTADWYSRADWEQKSGPSFYENGVFNRRCGGDLQGVLDQLDYLKKLGVNCIYFNPVFYARSLHKYDGNSFHHIDPHFGPDPAGDFALMAKETPDPKSWQWT